jgi:glycerophosphoryl diester phosphodiesterase
MHKLIPVLISLAALHFFSTPLAFANFSTTSKAGEPQLMQVYAHRGARSFAPENTMPAYEATLHIGADWVDMDVVYTKDGQILISHDPVMNPDIVRDAQVNFIAQNKEALKKMSPTERATFNQKYAAKNLTLAQLLQFDVGRLNLSSSYSKFFPDQRPVDGTHMPTLLEVIHYVNRITKNKVGFQIEMKTDPAHPEYSEDAATFAKALYKILKDEKIMNRAEIQAFDFKCLQELNKLNPKVKTAYLTSRDNEKGGDDDFFQSDAIKATLWTNGIKVSDYHNSIPQMVKAMGGFAWEPEDAELTQASLAEAHALGLKVVVWSWPERLGTAFDSKLINQMIDWRVDGIITDDPARLESILAVRRIPLMRGPAIRSST